MSYGHPPNAHRPGVVARHVSLERAGKLLLNRVTFEIRRTGIHGFVGTNGAGVSTLFRMIALQVQPTRGTLSVLGRPVRHGGAPLSGLIGYVPEQSCLYDALTVQEHLEVFAGGFGLGGRKRRARVDSVIEFMALEVLRHERCASLSKGMRRRVEVARALLHDPELLILDEPAADLDPRTRTELWERLRQLRSRGKTVVLSSHILSELEDLCDDLTVMHRRCVRYSGSLARFLAEAEATVEDHHYRVEVAEGVPLWERVFSDHEGVQVTSVEQEPHAVRFACARRLPVAGLLRSLLAAGVEVRSFEREPVSLIDHYVAVIEALEARGRR